MENFISLLLPGYLQAKAGQQKVATFWYLPWMLLVGVLLFTSLKAQETAIHAKSINLLGHEMSMDSFKIIVAALFYLATALFSMIDFKVKGDFSESENKAEDDAATEHKAWEKIMTVYLKNDFTQSLALAEKQIKINKKDFFGYYMLARLVSQKGEREKAQQYLKKCRKYDKDLYLKWECDHLQNSMQLTN